MPDRNRSGNKEFLMKKKASGRRTRRTHNPAFKAQVALENDFFESALTKAGLLSAKP